MAVGITTKKKMSDITGGRPHQGVMLECSPLPTIPAPQFVEGAGAAAAAVKGGRPGPIWVAADKVRKE